MENIAINISNRSGWQNLKIVQTKSGEIKLHGGTQEIFNAMRATLHNQCVYGWDGREHISYYPKSDKNAKVVLIDRFKHKDRNGHIQYFKDDLKIVLQAIEQAGFEVDWQYGVVDGIGETL